MNHSQQTTGLEIAIVGMAGRFPGARTIDEFWQNLCDGVETVTFFSDDELRAAGVKESLLQSPSYVKARAILEEAEYFDAPFFDMAPKEAEILDPQHRVFLECAWEALEHAGYDPEVFSGRIGIYAGKSINNYLFHHVLHDQALAEGSDEEFIALIGNDKDFFTTRVSYKLNLKGPSVTVQTACSTSLVAVHLACQSLLSGECDMALAGGCTIQVPQQTGYMYQEGGILSPDGHTRTFDAKAQGTLAANGAGLVVLKRLEDALEHHDTVYAIIKGSAINNDGSAKVGYTAPGVDGQTEVIRAAQTAADIEPDTIGYVEAHGTGTRLGDPIEVAALTKAFRTGTARTNFCALGSLKSNLGHLESAAGIASLIKATLTLYHGQIPPSLHFEQPNPQIDFDSSPFYVNTRLAPWPRTEQPRRAAVSSMGIGGTNAHVILQEAPSLPPDHTSDSWQLLTLSARSQSALDAQNIRLHTWLSQQSSPALADVAYTLHMGRRPFTHRCALLVNGANDALRVLYENPSDRYWRGQATMTAGVVFLFPGQGSQDVGMAQELYEQIEPFRQIVDACSQLLHGELGLDVRDVLFAAPGAPREQARKLLERTWLTQPALFVIEYALARLWMLWGVEPVGYLGHSLGEYVAACLAGVMSLEDALHLVAVRGRLMEQQPEGAMLSVGLSEEQARQYETRTISLAAINAPQLSVLAGPKEEIAQLAHVMEEQGVVHRHLRTSHAFHSVWMEAAKDAFRVEVKKVHLDTPHLPFISNVTGKWIREEQARDAEYWVEQLRQPVRFAQGLQEVMKLEPTVLLEVGPGKTLSTLARQFQEMHPNMLLAQSLDKPNKQGEYKDYASMLQALGMLWVKGVPLNWETFHQQEKQTRIALPTYPFEHKRYWIEPERRQLDSTRLAALSSSKEDIADWFYIPTWKQSMPPRPLDANTLPQSKHCWLLFQDTLGLGNALYRYLVTVEQDVFVVLPGDHFAKVDARTYSINPASQTDYTALFQDLRTENHLPDILLHLWQVNPQANTAISSTMPDEQALHLGFYSLLFIAQAIGNENITSALQIYVIANQMQWVSGDEFISPEKAMLLGPCKIIPKEYPNISCHCIDIPFSWAQKTDDGLVRRLISEILSAAPDMQVAYRGSNRLTHTFERIRLDKALPDTLRLREKGVYVISGGLGGIGLVFARYLAQSVQASLILLGRSTVPAKDDWEHWLTYSNAQDPVYRTIQQVQAIEHLGAEVLLLSADITDSLEMQKAFALIQDRFGTIHGVIHAAGVAGGGLIPLKTLENAASILKPKVQGTLALAAALQTYTLDFFLLCSSITAIHGEAGQVDYCAANIFLDAFAHNRSLHTGQLTIAVNWDLWAEVGMATANNRSSMRQKYILPGRTYKILHHPLLQRYMGGTAGRHTYAATLSLARHWVLQEHLIYGEATLPGTACIEMIRAAFADLTQNNLIEIQYIAFTTFPRVKSDENKILYVIFEQKNETTAFSLGGISNEQVWQEYAVGSIRTESATAIPQHDLSRMRLSYPLQPEKGSDYVGAIDGAFYGPRWNTIKSMYRGEQETFTLLELAPEFLEDLQQFYLHPALLDTATSFSIGMQVEGYVPFYYKSITIRGPLPPRIYSYVRYNPNNASHEETQTFTIALLNEDGQELITIEEYTFKKVWSQENRRAVSPTPQEERSPLPTSPSELSVVQPQKKGLSSAEGIEVFQRILAHCTLPNIVVSKKDLYALLKEQATVEQLDLEDLQGQTKSHAARYPRPDLPDPYVAPCNHAEQTLQTIWQELFGIEPIGIHDNFFALGGDSVLGIQILSKAKETGVQFSPNQLFRFPTIAELAEQSTGIPPLERAASDPQKHTVQEESHAGAYLDRPTNTMERETPQPAYTPSDFPDVQLSEEDLADLLAQITNTIEEDK